MSYISLNAVIIGSDTAVSVQALTSFPSTDLNNEMRGFAAFSNGFTLNGGGRCVFNSFYPIAGTVTLSGGTLSLSKDLILEKGISFYNGGIIVGNNKKITFLDTDVVELPVTNASAATFVSRAQVNTSKSVISCDFSYDAQHVVVVNNLLSTCKIYDFNGSSLVAAGTQSASTNFLCARWHPSLYYLATGRKQSVSTNNLELWQYIPDTNTFTLIDQKTQNKDITALAWHPSGEFLALGTASGGTGFALYELSNNMFTHIANVSLSPSRNVSANALSWDVTGTYLVAGTASSNASNGYEVLVYSFNGLTLTLNSYLDLNIVANAVSYSPVGNYIAVGLATGSERLRIYAHNPQEGTLVEQTSARIGESRSVLTVEWSPDGNYLAVGRTSGTGNELNIYFFNRDSKTLSLIVGYNVAAAVNSLCWSIDGHYLLVGDANNFSTIYEIAGNTLIFDSAKIEFNSDVLFTVATTFKGNSEINGKGHALEFDADGSLCIAAGATLTLNNVILRDITESTFYCAEDNAQVIFNNVIVELGAGDYSFNTGAFEVAGLLHIKGPYGFHYQTNQISTINSNGTLYIDQGSTFNYNPLISANNLLTFADATSSFIVHCATLQVSNVGLQLTKGYIGFDGKSYVINSGTQASQGLVLGDGISSANNVTLRILPEAQCLLTSGFIVDKSV